MLSDSVNTYTPGISQRNAATSQSKFFVTDAQGSLRGTHDSNTSLTDDICFDSFGQQAFHGGTAPSALPLAWHQASNYQTDADTGLMLLGNRYYDPSIGRFLSHDPAKHGTNYYEYCLNNPMGYVDPSGLYEVTVYITKWEEKWNGQSKQWEEIPGSRYVDQEYSFEVPNDMSFKGVAGRASLMSPLGIYNISRDNSDRHLPLRGPNASLDVKQRGNQFQDSGNALFGIAASASGIDERVALRLAGHTQVKSGTSRPGWGSPGNLFNPFGGVAPFGDDPHDQALIKIGYDIQNPFEFTFTNNIVNVQQTTVYKH